MYVRNMSGTVLSPPAQAMIAAMRTLDTALATGFTGLSHTDLTAVLDEHEILIRQLPGHGYRMLAELQAQRTAVEMGATNWRQVLATRLRISTAEAGRRLSAA